MIILPWAFRATVRLVAATHNLGLATIFLDARGCSTLRVSLGRGVASVPGGFAQLVSVEAAVAARWIRLTCLAVGIPMASSGAI